LAPGPGYLAVEIARSGAYAVTGLDISHSFVRISRERAKTAGVPVDFQHGNAAQMPFSADSFDFVVCVAAFKNFAEPAAALDEIHRVLRPGGHALIHDLRKDASLDDIDKEVGAMQLSTFNAAVTRWVFRHVLLKSAYSSQALAQLVAHSRFGSADIRSDGIAIELRLDKDDQML
jgi:ubiquinone/menaquinone biosynthesis C-methylase UbiE